MIRVEYLFSKGGKIFSEEIRSVGLKFLIKKGSEIQTPPLKTLFVGCTGIEPVTPTLSR
jgi:hypothetical protein